jgi:hypothetical protein
MHQLQVSFRPILRIRQERGVSLLPGLARLTQLPHLTYLR